MGLSHDSDHQQKLMRAGKLSSIVRSVTHSDTSPRSSQNTPTPWEKPASKDDPLSPRDYQNRDSQNSRRDSRDSQRMRIEKLGIGQQLHRRNESGNASS